MLQPYLAVAAVVTAASLLQVANGLIGLLLPVELAAAGQSGTVIGLVATAYGAGFLLGCLRAPRLVRAVGHIRAFAALAALSAATTLLFLATTAPWLWIGLRFATGFALAGLFSTVEGWLSAATADVSRGRVLAVYLVLNKLSTVVGQVLLGVGWFASGTLFAVASGVFSLALVPVALTRAPEPPPPRLVGLHLGAMWRIAPAAVVGCLGAGLMNSAVPSLVPVWAARLGVPVGLVVVLLAAMQVGSLLVQWPLGWLSDRIDRRHVILACVASVALTSMAIASIGAAHPALLTGLFALWGAFSMSFYGICVAHAGDHARAEEMVLVASSALFAWASGSAVGPLIAAPLLDLIGPSGPFIYAAVVSSAVAGFIGWRMTRRPPVPVAERESFVNLPATSPTLAELDPRRPRGV
jgi:MFS family permease